MKRRVRHDEMKPIDEPIWLVVRDKYKTAISIQQYPPNTDPIPVMVEAMSKSIRLGFAIDQMPGNFAVYFCTKGDETNQVAIERVDPNEPANMHSSARFDSKPPENITQLKR